MSQQRITDALTTAFSSHSIVFWHDADGEFRELLAKAKAVRGGASDA